MMYLKEVEKAAGTRIKIALRLALFPCSLSEFQPLFSEKRHNEMKGVFP